MSSIVVGGLYSARQRDGSFRVVKVLAAGEGTVHLRLYAEKFQQPPPVAASSELSLGSLPSGSFGIGHYPVSETGFLQTEKTLLAEESVAESELDGYRIWLAHRP